MAIKSYPRSNIIKRIYYFHFGRFQKRNTTYEPHHRVYILDIGSVFYIQEIVFTPYNIGSAGLKAFEILRFQKPLSNVNHR